MKFETLNQSKFESFKGNEISNAFQVKGGNCPTHDGMNNGDYIDMAASKYAANHHKDSDVADYPSCPGYVIGDPESTELNALGIDEVEWDIYWGFLPG